MSVTKPFLTWAGGKSKLLPLIQKHAVLKDIYVEPFAGGGSVFLNMPGYKHYIINDINPDVVNTFWYVQRDGIDFIDQCAQYFKPENNTKEVYYQMRDRFNELIGSDSKERSALFVYLNKHCFNGICRYNKKGEFNVPFGGHKQVNCPLYEMLDFHDKTQGMIFTCIDFHRLFEIINDHGSCFIYCDPPYVKETKNKHQGAPLYAPAFTSQDHADLARLAQECPHPCIISNHDTEETRALYSTAELITFQSRRVIAARSVDRRDADELLAIFHKTN